MIYAEIACFFLIVTGCFLIIGMTPKEFLQKLTARSITVKPIKKQIDTKKRKKKNVIIDMITEAKTVMLYGGITGGIKRLFIFSGVCALVGVILSTFLENIFLIPTMGIGFASIPFIYLKISGNKIKHALNDELETALSIITTTYLRTEDIVQAVDENLAYINQPLKHTFQKFSVGAKYVDTNIAYLLEKMKDDISNDIFAEWIDVLIMCQNDKNKKNILVDVVGKLSDVRVVSAELDNLMYAPIKEFISILGMFCSLPVILYFALRDWFDMLFFTTAGKVTFSVCILVITVSMFGAVNVTKPIEYKR